MKNLLLIFLVFICSCDFNEGVKIKLRNPCACPVYEAAVLELDYAITIAESGSVAGKLIARRINTVNFANETHKCDFSHSWSPCKTYRQELKDMAFAIDDAEDKKELDSLLNEKRSILKKANDDYNCGITDE